VLSLLLQVLASAITVTAIVADAEFGDCFAVGRLFHTLGLSNVLGYFDRRCVQSNVKTGCSTSGATATITI
jgi:hypothetical protein